MAMDAAAERKPRRDEFIDLPVVATDSSASSSFAAHRAVVEGWDTEARRSARVAAGRKPVLVAGRRPRCARRRPCRRRARDDASAPGRDRALVVMDADAWWTFSSCSALSLLGDRATCQRFPMRCGNRPQMLGNLGSYLPTFVVNYSIPRIVGRTPRTRAKDIWGFLLFARIGWRVDAMWDRIVVFLAFLAHHIDAARLTPRANTIGPSQHATSGQLRLDGRGCVDSRDYDARRGGPPRHARRGRLRAGRRS